NTKTAGFGIMTQHYALNQPPKYHAGDEAGRAALQNFAPPTLEGFLRLFDDFDYGDVGSGHSMLAAHVNSQFDPSRAPPGKATLTLFGFAPFDLRGGASWAGRKADIGRWMRAQ